MRERDIEAYFIRRVRETGGVQRKFVSPGVRGVPDRIVGFPNGVFAFVELKAPGETARPDQLREHARWQKLGFLVYVVDSKPAVDVVIDYLLLRGG
jgi:hypothetical protein